MNNIVHAPMNAKNPKLAEIKDTTKSSGVMTNGTPHPKPKEAVKHMAMSPQL
jgi:hypothetical protein